MRIFFDTEFIENGKTIQLISIGAVNEDGGTFYAVSNEYNPEDADKWVKENVLSKIPKDQVTLSRKEIANAFLDWCGDKPEFWAYYADYDWVVLCQLYGRMIDLPKGWPMYCRDIKQVCDLLGNPKLPEQGKGEHNALRDAEWNLKAYDFLKHYTPRSCF